MTTPICTACNEYMKKAVTGKPGIGASLTAVGLMLMGVALSLTCIGAVVGVPMMAVGAKYAGKAKKQWRCRRCGHTVDR